MVSLHHGQERGSPPLLDRAQRLSAPAAGFAVAHDNGGSDQAACNKEKPHLSLQEHDAEMAGSPAGTPPTDASPGSTHSLTHSLNLPIKPPPMHGVAGLFGEPPIVLKGEPLPFDSDRLVGSLGGTFSTEASQSAVHHLRGLHWRSQRVHEFIALGSEAPRLLDHILGGEDGGMRVRVRVSQITDNDPSRWPPAIKDVVPAIEDVVPAIEDVAALPPCPEADEAGLLRLHACTHGGTPTQDTAASHTAASQTTASQTTAFQRNAYQPTAFQPTASSADLDSAELSAVRSPRRPLRTNAPLPRPFAISATKTFGISMLAPLSPAAGRRPARIMTRTPGSRSRTHAQPKASKRLLPAETPTAKAGLDENGEPAASEELHAGKRPRLVRIY